MSTTLLFSPFSLWTLRAQWMTFNSMLSAHYRRAELLDLIGWAKRKRLPAPHRLYTSRHFETERLLHSYAMRFPRLFWWARVAYYVNRLITTEPRYKTKGSAAKYRYNYKMA